MYIFGRVPWMKVPFVLWSYYGWLARRDCRASTITSRLASIFIIQKLSVIKYFAIVFSYLQDYALKVSTPFTKD